MILGWCIDILWLILKPNLGSAQGKGRFKERSFDV